MSKEVRAIINVLVYSILPQEFALLLTCLSLIPGKILVAADRHHVAADIRTVKPRHYGRTKPLTDN